MRRLVGAITVVAFLVVATPAEAGGRPLSADLASENEVPDSGTGASGVASLTLNQGQGEVCVAIDADGLAGAVVAGHIHVGAAGVNGPVVVDLGVNSANFTACISGVDRGVIKAIRQNPFGYYVNVHTTVVPSGEIRGQLSK